MMIEPLRLPADFIVGQKVGLVGGNTRFGRAIDAARTETLRPRGIHHPVLIDLVSQVDSRHVAAIYAAFIQVLAGRAHGDRRLFRSNRATLGFSGAARRGATPIAEETLKGIVSLEIPLAAAQCQLRGDIPRHLGEDRFVSIDASFFGEPYGVVEAWDRLCRG